MQPCLTILSACSWLEMAGVKGSVHAMRGILGTASGLAPHSPSQYSVSFDGVAWFGRVRTQFGSTAPVLESIAYTPLHCIW
ncbi:hypothetical protein COO60DRAFT_1496571 [Scenedesmus sp. NREL 46B-D3]|nr:hypothetical protein COO60DRAFT_1496571 [Scenedesmus sp. NREL 46B-D3]